MFTLNYKVTTSCCDENGKLKLYSALQMMQDCSEMWINTEAGVKKYFEENGMAQLLVFRQVEVNRVPAYGEDLTVTTRARSTTCATSSGWATRCTTPKTSTTC